MDYQTVLYWFRRDLRLADNVALTQACQSSQNIIPVFILDSSTTITYGAAQKWWLYHSLKQLSASLQKINVNIYFARGNSLTILLELQKRYKAQAIYWNRVYEPEEIIVEHKIEKTCQQLGVDVYHFNSSLLLEPSLLTNMAGNAYKVFTPFYHAAQKIVFPQQPLPLPRRIVQKENFVGDDVENWSLLPRQPNWSIGFSIWQPGEKQAQKKLHYFLENNMDNYDQQRDFPARGNTSGLSSYLHFGEISAQQILAAIRIVQEQGGDTKGVDIFKKQLFWREFAYYLLYHFPDLATKNFNPGFDHFNWHDNQTLLHAWQKGETGYPLVDAGMKQLWHTGFMHNRVRMITASFLSKHLLIDWRFGFKWFFATLLDADIANNALGWQWVAGSGPDAAPYFRIFNPVLQAKKFDPEASYIKKWLPELQDVAAKDIHCPDKLLKKSYPQPIIEHQVARVRAIDAYQKCKNYAD
jgi:deoxyribodipyrimidine photo-lyase